MDPYDVLGLTRDASAQEVERAYRELAKRLHPDVVAGPSAQARMAMINAARDAIRSAAETANDGAPFNGTDKSPRDRRGPGHWLSDRVRSALLPELVRELQPFEDVRLVVRASMWQSPQVVLVVTEHRLLWSPLHSFSPRVHVLRHGDVERISQRVRRPLRRRAVVELVTHAGRRVGFGDLDPDAAALIERNVADGMG